MQSRTLDGKTALVTGASRGIGRAIAVQLARIGATVSVNFAADEVAAKETVALIESDGGQAFAVRAELGQAGAIDSLIDETMSGLARVAASSHLDILINNAAVTGFEGAGPAEVTDELLNRCFSVNAKAPFQLIQRVLDVMPDGGRIVNISSGVTHSAFPQQIAYAMGKGALEQVTLHYAPVLAQRNITINTVAPGITNNGDAVFDDPRALEQMASLSAFNRVGTVDEVADIVTLVASPGARWMTGAFVDATGGTLLG